ncbi:signal peptide protein [Skermanella stibiiresistens SB22]|uniref:Signal peptide protein n=1 Tax=Skermanella stibiiresistens SB22 TaxID=1385369 RepID=W9HCI9_9PROT|nr:hypothetical protein [Skermanella stibiiresistens]EWY42451.1 signal peptide protein [Skermanella stibiiresistens SB22]
MFKMSRHHTISGALIATIALGAATVYAQSGPSLWDPAQLPETKGVVKQYTPTPRGDIDGLILTDGTEVKLPPHLTSQVVFAVKPGDQVTVRGLKARAVPLVDGASITNDATGVTVTDNGPPDANETETTVSGRIATVLHGKRGEVNGAVLEDGVTLRLPPPEAARFSDLLQTGRMISARGISLTTLMGTLVEARAIGATPEQLTELAVRPPMGPKGHGPGAGPGHGPGGRDGIAPPPPPRG